MCVHRSSLFDVLVAPLDQCFLSHLSKRPCLVIYRFCAQVWPDSMRCSFIASGVPPPAASAARFFSPAQGPCWGEVRYPHVHRGSRSKPHNRVLNTLGLTSIQRRPWPLQTVHCGRTRCVDREYNDTFGPILEPLNVQVTWENDNARVIGRLRSAQFLPGRSGA